MKKQRIAVSMLIAGGLLSPLAHATNGMNLEGYGPMPEAMGGASMAYDNGTAAVMNNPATLGLMSAGGRMDIAIGGLFPKISSSMPTMPTADSGSNAFYMPAMGYARKADSLTYGVAVFSQGGMGTEYAGNSIIAAGSGQKVRSEVGVGRFILPLAYQSGDLTIGGSVDYVWAGMDLQMAMSGAQFLDMSASGTQSGGTVGGSMMTAFNGAVGAGMISSGMGGAPSPVNWGYFDFSNSDNFTGKAKGAGLAQKIGFTFKMNPQLTVGATYHTKTAMSDLSAEGAKVSFNANMDNNLLGGTWNGSTVGTAAGTYSAVTVPVTGKIAVKNFQWPETYGFGMAFQANDDLLLVADFKRIGWKSVMKDFKMTFTADATQASPLAAGFAGTVLDATLYQNWDDQNVIELGGAYKTSAELTLRAGVNLANNPVPDKYMNPLFPAIAKNHATAGFGYAFSKASEFNMSFVYVPKVSATNAAGVTVDFAGYSTQLAYSYMY